VTLWIRDRLNNPGLETVQGLLVPFAAYITAEHLHASGVLAVVIAGFVVGNGSLSSGYQTRLQERYVWNSVDVLLEAFVFAYIGLHLRFVLQDLRDAHESMTEVAIASLVVLGVVLVIRPIWVSLMFGRSWLSRQIDRELRSGADTSPTWQEHAVVSWTGMRGVVTLAAAAGIPLTTASGEPFPQRALIQAVAFVVAVGTLLLQGATLPAMIRRLGVSSPDGGDLYAREHLEAERIVHDAAEGVLSEFAASPPEGLDPGVVAEIRETIARHSQDADHMPDPDEHTLRAEVFSALYRDVLVAQRAVLIAERDAGNVDDEAVRAMLDRLDLQEAGVTARLESRF
jgi:CPA1 family monovalent cation:H+ antiporter